MKKMDIVIYKMLEMLGNEMCSEYEILAAKLTFE